MVTHVTLLGMETITSQRMTATRRSTFWLFGPILSLLLLLPLLQSAAKLDIHYVDKNQPPYGDHRFYAGLFLLYGFCAAIPSLATAVVSSRFRKLSISVVALCLLLASVCEIVVTFASQPWFTF